MAHAKPSNSDHGDKLAVVRKWGLRVGIAFLAVAVLTIVFLFLPFGKGKKEINGQQTQVTSTSMTAAKPIHQATPELTLTANPNDGNDADDGDWATLKGKPGWTMCVGDLTGIEQQFKGKGGGWNSSIPPGGPTHWRFRSTTGKPETVEYNFDTSERCDTPVSLA